MDNSVVHGNPGARTRGQAAGPGELTELCDGNKAMKRSPAAFARCLQNITCVWVTLSILPIQCDSLFKNPLFCRPAATYVQPQSLHKLQNEQATEKNDRPAKLVTNKTASVSEVKRERSHAKGVCCRSPCNIEG